jgi:septal ring factor EnvC (AmiA/AmiB activator)
MHYYGIIWNNRLNNNEQIVQMEEEIEELNSLINSKDAQCQEMSDVIAYLEKFVESKASASQNLANLQSEFSEKCKIIDQLTADLQKSAKISDEKTSHILSTFLFS